MQFSRILIKKSKLFILIVPIFLLACGETEIIPQDLVPFVPVESIIEDEFEGIEYVVYGNSTYATMVAYSRTAEDGTLLDFENPTAPFPIILEDNEGNVWDIFGLAVSGPRKGQTLTPINAMMGYWFSFASIFPKATIYGEEEHEKVNQNTSNPDWLVNSAHVFSATSKDAIPALSFPSFNQIGGRGLVDESLYVSDEELVVIIPASEEIKIIPYKILDWHEVVNHNLDDIGIVISYCPLTGTSTAWVSSINANGSEFGVSGLLYNNNLILYDQETDSYWSQIRQQAIHGSSIGASPKRVRSLEMTWKGAKLLKKGIISLLDNKTGFDRDYAIYPYGDYKTNNNNLSFPLSFEDSRVPNKEKVLSVTINERSKVYRFEHFQ